ncbi:MAG: hypothetical protein P4L86_19855 [Mycobacterium sp.]|nr:hypothetical protein [Mycobacterium sp.]
MRLSRRRLLYAAVATAIAAWAVAIVCVTVSLRPVEHYLISYYVVDYRFGFIRRGLAGELVSPIDSATFFGRATAVRWTVTAVYLSALALVSAAMLRTGRSERRIMVALMLPTLTFGVPFAVFSARPDLLGAAAVAIFALGVAAQPHRILLWSAIYGSFTTALALAHEAIPLEFALGAVLASYVLAHDLTPARRRMSAVVAVGPGLAATAAVAAFTRRGVSDQLCAAAPHRLMPMMTSFPDFQRYLQTGQLPPQEFHDWVCRWFLPKFDQSIVGAMRDVAAWGVGGLALSLGLGAVGLVAGIAAVQYVSGVPFRDFLSELRGRWAGPICALALFVPVFATAFDWTRWVVVIAFNITVVYLVYLRGRPELDRPPPPRTVWAFVAITTAFALLPLGLVPGGGTG